jgi:hypothetical protein
MGGGGGGGGGGMAGPIADAMTIKMRNVWDTKRKRTCASVRTTDRRRRARRRDDDMALS